MLWILFTPLHRLLFMRFVWFCISVVMGKCRSILAPQTGITCDFHRSCVQEIPAAFTKKTGWPETSDCILVTSTTSMKQWPVLFNRQRGTIVSLYEGWTEFLHDQGIEVGNFMVFEYVDDQCLVVAIYPPESESKFKKTLKATHTRPAKGTRLVSYGYLPNLR